MKSFKKILLWYSMLNKRLLHKRSFIFLLCMIPLLLPLANAAMQGESGVVKILLCSEDKNPAAMQIIENLMTEDGIILFENVENADAAEAQVRAHRADAAWIFANDFEKAVAAYAAKATDEPFVTVLQREDTVPLKLSREKLYGSVFETFSYALYENYVYSDLVTPAIAEKEAVKRYYEDMRENRDVVVMRQLDSEQEVQSAGYLTVPLRGMLSLLVMLCGFAAALYFLKDQADGKYDWMPVRSRIVPAFATCLAAVVLASAAVLAALHVSGIGAGFTDELCSMVLFALAGTGFCLCLCMIFRSVGKLGAAIPGLLILMLVLSPIFFNMKILRPIRLMLPTYYYLQATTNAAYDGYMLLYCIGVYAFAFVLNLIFNRRERKASVLG